MSVSSGEDVIPLVEYVECEALVDEGEPTERMCDYAGFVDAWADPPAGTWGWTCPNADCEHTHVHSLDSLRSYP